MVLNCSNRVKLITRLIKLVKLITLWVAVAQVESEVGKWPTPLWKDWTRRALCPTYAGHDDQEQYSQYKFTNKLP